MSFLKNIFSKFSHGEYKVDRKSSIPTASSIPALSEPKKPNTVSIECVEIINGPFNVSNFQSYINNYKEVQHLNKFIKSNLSPIDNNKKQIRHQIVFIMDATGSMQQYIDGTKIQIKKFMTDIKTKVFKDFEDNFFENKNDFEFVYEVAIVAYRDFTDKKQFETLDFTTDINSVETFLSEISADGGADFQEDVKGAFIHTLFGIESTSPKLSWEDHGHCASRTIMWLADAPPHGKKFNHTIGGDNYSTDDNGWEFIRDEMNKLEVNFTIVKLCDKTDDCNKEFKNLYGAEIIDVSQMINSNFKENSEKVFKSIEEITCTKTYAKSREYVTTCLSKTT